MASDDSVIKNKDLNSMWRAAVATKFEVLSQDLLGGTEENQNLIQDRRSPGRVLNRYLPSTNKGPLPLYTDFQYLLCMFIIHAINFLQQ